MLRLISTTAVAGILLISGCSQEAPSTEIETMPDDPSAVTETTAVELNGATQLTAGPSLSALEFGGPDLLFAASNDNGTVYAFTLDENDAGAVPDRPTPYNIENFGTQLSEFLGVSPFDIAYNDLAVHPVSSAAFLSLTVRDPDGDKPALVKVTQDGTITFIDTNGLDTTRTELDETASADVVFWRDIPAASLTVTDLEFSDGKLLVAGLSTGEFASTLRQFDYPFTGSARASSIEIFHTAHNQNETRAPIRAMTMVPIDGEPTLVAAYTCTPLVTIPAANLADGAHVVGKTIAELGYGNVPVEVLAVTAFNAQTRQPEEFILVINREMSANLIRMEDLTEAAAGPGLTTAFQGLGDTMGVENTRHPTGGVLQADNQDAQFLLMLRRNIDTGEMELISQMKGAYFRLSDFVSEYNFPDYVYAENQAGTQQFHNMVKPMEGYPELVIQ
ncbi:MAG: hypothetical protein AAFS13_07300 [Pseudomonadota bacterium]